MSEDIIIEVKKDALACKVSQMMTTAVNDEVEKRLLPIRNTLKGHLMFVSAIIVAGAILWAVASDIYLLKFSLYMGVGGLVWVTPLWYFARFSPLWIDVHWNKIDDDSLVS